MALLEGKEMDERLAAEEEEEKGWKDGEIEKSD